MSQPATQITLAIRETGAAAQRALVYHVLVDGEVVAGNRALSPAQSRAVRDLARRFGGLFEQHLAPRLALDAQQALGDELFALWLADVWDQVRARAAAGAPRTLVIASDVAAVLNLPWELARLPGGDFVGFDPTLGVRRLPRPDPTLAAFRGALPPSPLRVLFVACAPQDQDPLDYEREEEVLLAALAHGGPQVALDSGDLGTFEELRDRINDFQPHVVHLTGHAIVARRCPSCRQIMGAEDERCRRCDADLRAEPAQGFFAFEDERGQTDLRGAREMVQQLFAGSGVQCAFISGCQSGKAPPIDALGGICQGLVGSGLPLAIGWAASIEDTIATRFAETFYRTLTINQQIGDRVGEAATWHQLATIDLRVGDYEAAREKFGRALSMRQQIGDRAGEAATWHQLATIDVETSDYEAAHEKFGRSMSIKQQLGDRAGEAATFYQLGMLAKDQGRLAEGTALVALCYLIDRAIGHGNTERVFRALSTLASQLAYTQEQLDDLLRRVAEAYQADRGAGLLRAAFPSA